MSKKVKIIIIIAIAAIVIGGLIYFYNKNKKKKEEEKERASKQTTPTSPTKAEALKKGMQEGTITVKAADIKQQATSTN